jgi:hypothetical protein
MPRLNHVFEELGIHHEEHKVPAKVPKSLEDKARKAATKNTTAVAKVKKRKGTGRAKAISKKLKVGAAAAAASTGSIEKMGVAEEEVGEMEASIAGADVDPMASTVQGLDGGPVLSAPDFEPLPSMFRHASTSSSS